MVKCSLLIGLLFLLSLTVSCIHNEKLAEQHHLFFYHRVQNNETLRSIASKYYVPWQVIWGVNKIKNPHVLEVGQRLKIPATNKALDDPTLKQQSPVVGERSKNLDGIFYSAKTPFLWPVEGQVSSYFGLRNGRPHEGIDIRAPRGKSIYAAQQGIVEFVGWKNGYGRTIIIDHGEMKTLYAHLSAFKVKRKQVVDRGTKIGLVGASGNANGSHLHFEVYKSGNPINPISMLAPRRGAG